MYATLALPAALTAVEEEAFADLRAEALIVILPENCVSVGPSAFRNCAARLVMVIPANNAVFSENAFAGCDSVTFRCSRNSSAAQYAAANGAIRCEYTD